MKCHAARFCNDSGDIVGAVLATSVAILVVFATWARGGTPARFHAPLFVAGVALIVASVVLPALASRSHPFRRARGTTAYPVVGDPLFWLGAAFVLLLATQWWNAGRYLVFDSPLGRWDYSPPPHPGWPSSIMRREAAEMLCWFLPAWAVVVAVRSSCVNRIHVWGLYYTLAANAAVLAAFGIYRFLTGSRTIWGDAIGEQFFATFGYINHAATFFVLATALTVGLLLREYFASDRRCRAWVIVALLLAAVLNLVAVHLSFSRAGMFLAWSFVLVAGVYSIRRSRRDMSPARQAYLVLALLGAALIAFLVTAHLAYREVLCELEERIGQPGFTWTQYFVANRDRTFCAAWAIWKDNRWFGVGGWGFAHLLPCYIPPSLWAWAAIPGWANVHNDPLQFLVEFGIVGFGILASVVAVLVAAILRSGVWRRGMAVMVVLGCGLVWAHSLIDIPFRCPAILFMWALLLASLPRLSREESPASHCPKQSLQPQP